MKIKTYLAGFTLLKATALFSFTAISASIFAQPSSPTVVAGGAEFSSSGPLCAITSCDKTIINWQSFSIGEGETTQFNLPNAASAVLNRVTG